MPRLPSPFPTLRRGPAVTAALAAVALFGPADAAASPTIPGPSGPAEPTVEIAISSLEPAVPQPGDVLVIKGAVTNVSDAPQEHVQALFRHNLNPLGGRSELPAVAENPRQAWGSRPGHVFDEITGMLLPGRSAGFRLEMVVETSCPVAQPGALPCVQIQHPGVYVIGVDVREGDPHQPGARVDAGTVLTYLPWLIDGDEHRVPVALLWPVTTSPVADDPDGTMPVDRASAMLGPAGWLQTMVDAPGDAPVTWAIDPDVLNSVAALADAGGVPVASANDWRDRLRDRTRGASAWLLPFATPDLAAFAPEVSEDLAREAIRVTRSAREQVPGARAGLAWPVAGGLTDGTGAALAAAGYDAVVLDGSVVAAPPGGPWFSTAGDETSVAAVITDPGLDSAIRAAGSGTVTFRQLWLAETALVAADPLRRSGPLITSPPPGWQPTEQLAGDVIAAWTETPWVEPVPLDPATDRPTTVIDLPESVEPVLPPANAAATTDLHTAVHQYQALVGVAASEDYTATILRSASSFWRDDPQRGLAHARAAGEAVAEYLDEVSLQVAPAVTLSSNTGAFPVNVVNNLDVPVTVRLELHSANPDRMAVESVASQRIEAGETEILRVTAEAVANGRVRVDMQLATIDGVPLGEARYTIVNATDYGLIGWFVIAGAALLFAAGLAVRTSRGRRRNGPARGDHAGRSRSERPGHYGESVPLDEVTR
jgi:hypothetical protein